MDCQMNLSLYTQVRNNDAWKYKSREGWKDSSMVTMDQLDIDFFETETSLNCIHLFSNPFNPFIVSCLSFLTFVCWYLFWLIV